MTMRRLLLLGLALAWVPIASAAAADARLEFMAAMDAVRQSRPDTADSPALQAYAIHDYLTAARLRRDLAQRPDDGVDAAIDAFLSGHGGQPVTRALRREWLSSLGQRRRWERFLPISADVTDPQLVCDRLAGRLATGDTDGLAATALMRWLQPQRQPLACNEVFAWLGQQNLLNPALAEQRARAALAA
ncbi:MAG TPA: hypothetical protein VHV81_17700, partial [Steroidobacteraceae bacterium]|nr:hypothetical protein [Steroidobacteraceae bacterium]